MSKFKMKQFSDIDKQKKITCFFSKSRKNEQIENLKEFGKYEFNPCQSDLNAGGSKILDNNSKLAFVDNEMKRQNTSPLKECLNLIQINDKNNDSKYIGHSYSSPNQHNSPQQSIQQKRLNSCVSPDFIPASPALRKKIRKKDLKQNLKLDLQLLNKEDDYIKTNIEIKDTFSADSKCNSKNNLQCQKSKKSLEHDLKYNQSHDTSNKNNISVACINSDSNLKFVQDEHLLTNPGLNIQEENNRKQKPNDSEFKNCNLFVNSNTEYSAKIMKEFKLERNMYYKQNLKANHQLVDNSSNSIMESPEEMNASSSKKYNEEMGDKYFFEDLDLNVTKYNITSLASSVRCKVVSIELIPRIGEVVLGVKTFQEDTCITCVLRDTWANCKVSVGDIVIISAKAIDNQPGCWKVDNEFGSIILHPDTLVSGTSLLGSLFCMRKSVLSDSYHDFSYDSKCMVLGSILHTFLQEVLKRNVNTFVDIKGIGKEIISRKELLYTLYSSELTLEDTCTELDKFVPLIHDFVQQYVHQNDELCVQPQKTYDKDKWDGKITGIADIEENIWAPRLGLKGKIDVTVHAKNHFKKKVMPLELKTGRASFSSEHKGQVSLYTMMMADIGQPVESGLLLYLRDGLMKEVVVGNAECRDLIQLRNQFVYHLESSKKVSYDEKRYTIEVPALPEPISHHSACSKCSHLLLCSAALTEKGREQLSISNPLHALSLRSTEHLSKEHIQYIFHWSGLLRLEHFESLKNGNKIQNIWTLSPKQREENGNCLSNVTLDEMVRKVSNGYYEHTFKWSGPRSCYISEGEYLIVSSPSRVAVAAGTVRYVSDNSATLHLERDLSRRGENTWHLDRYESQSWLTFNLSNLGHLVEDTEEVNLVRKYIISLEDPIFCDKLSPNILNVGADLLTPLNSEQRNAIQRSLAAQHYVLIKGMPGTGKTVTIVSLVLLAVKLGQTILITSHTHSAVDNVLLRLKGKVEFLRLGSSGRLHPDLIQFGENNNLCTTPEQLETFYNSKPVVGVTCLGSNHALLRKRKFDLCLVDEATQVLQPTVLRPLFSAKKFILIGDPEQLSPLVKSQEAKKMGLGVSLFERLDRPEVTTVLSLQYRMNETITKLANHLTYNGDLSCGNESIKNATIKFIKNMENQPSWIKCALSLQLENAVVVVDTGYVTSNSSCSNQIEADIVIQLLDVLKKGGFSENDIGVISPYKAQVFLLRKQASAANISVEINTVDQYQGRDKDVIIYSCTHSSQVKEFDILNDKKRMTVAVTRARHKLIFIGNVQLLKGYAVFQKLFSFISESNFISLVTTGSNFSDTC